MLWQTSRRTFDLRQRGLIMGVLNVTPDSFSDGGRYTAPDLALAHGRALLAAGAEILDIGGESTRPGAEPVSAEEELRRVLPVIQGLADAGAALSIDTRHPAVAEAALAAGAEILNDITGLQQPEMRALAARTGAGAIAMHMQGEPRTMQQAPHYADVITEVRDFFRQTWHLCLRSGMETVRLAFDPGIGFGKTATHNLQLLQNLSRLGVEERPLVLGVSRKGFLGRLLGTEAMADRTWPTVALTSYGRTAGARVFRVHEVEPNLQALRCTEALLAA